MLGQRLVIKRDLFIPAYQKHQMVFERYADSSRMISIFLTRETVSSTGVFLKLWT
jgi:hypothetical protein